MNFDDLTKTIVNTADVARFEGILELQKIEKEAQSHTGGQNDLFNLGLRLIIDGVSPQLVEEFMADKKKTLVHQFETQLNMIMAGLQATQKGHQPRMIDQKLRVMY